MTVEFDSLTGSSSGITADVPLLAYDLGDSRNGKPPFRFAEEHPPEEALCSCPNLAQPTTPPRHALCTFCPA